MAYSFLFMDAIHKTYVLTAFGVWTAVGALAGAVVGVLLSFSGREMIFPMTLGMGIIWLIMVQIIIRRQPKLLLPPTLTRPNSRPPANAAPADRVLPPDEARAWLDDFLVKQQKK